MANPVGRPNKYPWDKWFNGREHTINVNELDCGIPTLRTNACRHARRRGLKVSIHIEKVQVGRSQQSLVKIRAIPNGKTKKTKRKLVRSS